MRRRLSSIGAAALAIISSHATAQSSDATGAAFLLLPVGARAVGIGQAMMGEETGSEGIWWNPASIAQQKEKEFAIHHSQTVVAVGDAITFLTPARIGRLAVSLDVLNFGDQQVTDEQGPVGVILPRNLVVAGTYARSVGSRFNGGLSYKLIQFRVDCSGQCANVATFAATANAVDLGAQYHVRWTGPIVLGAAVRNIGSRLRVDQRSDADPLPTRIEFGGSYTLTLLEKYVSDIDLRIASSMMGDKHMQNVVGRVGADLVWEKRVHLRAGYAGEETNGAGAALGFGVVAGKLQFDIARSFGGLSSDAGQPPTYFSLRYLF